MYIIKNLFILQIQIRYTYTCRMVIAEIERTIDIIITCGVGRNRKKNILEKFKVKIFAVHTTRSKYRGHKVQHKKYT